MRILERSGQLILGLAILLIFGFLLPETERTGITYLAATLLGLLAGLRVFSALRERSLALHLGFAAGGIAFLGSLCLLMAGLCMGPGKGAQLARHGVVFILSLVFAWFLLAVLTELRRTYRGWKRILFHGIFILFALNALFFGDAELMVFFWIVLLLFGIRWHQVRSVSPGWLAFLILAAGLAAFTPFLGRKLGAISLIPLISTTGVGFSAGGLAAALFDMLRVGVRCFCGFFAILGAYHWAAVLLFGHGRLRAKLLGAYFLTALIPLALFAALVIFGFYLIVASYRSTLTKNLFQEQQVRFQRWLAATSSRPAFWESLRPVEKGVRRLPLAQLDLYPKALFDVLREKTQESDSVWVYVVVGSEEDTIRISKELRQGGTVMGVCHNELCLYALLPTRGFMLRSWTPVTREFLTYFKEITGTDITIYPGGPRSAQIRFGGPFGGAVRRVEFSLADNDSVAEFGRVSTREPHRKTSWLDWGLVAGMNILPGVDWQTGKTVNYFYLLWLTPARLWETVFNPKEPINLEMRAAFYLLVVIFVGGMVAISLFGWRVAGGINRSARSLEKGVQELRAGHLDFVMPVVGGTEFRQVAESFNLLTGDIRRMLRDLTEKERLESELTLARTIQEALLPRSLPCMRGVEMAARSLPARIVGGDFYDVISQGDGSILVALGDVSGKGIASALVTAKVQASLRTLAMTYLSLPELMMKLNQAACQGATPGMFVSLFLARLNPQLAYMEYVNGGHDFPILCRNGQAEYLSNGGLILGVFPDAIYDQGIAEELDRSRLLIYTDGFVETRNPHDREFGVEALTELVRMHKGPADGLLDTLFNEVDMFSQGQAAEDDRTAMALLF
jgi:serine phosphatase RsbU (regulator of sigma subunit)